MTLDELCRAPQRHLLLIAQLQGNEAVDTLPTDDGKDREAYLPQLHCVGNEGRYCENGTFVAQDCPCYSRQCRTDTVVGGTFGPRDVVTATTGAFSDWSKQRLIARKKALPAKLL